MFEYPLVSFFSILIITTVIGFGISLFFYKTTLLKRILLSPVIGYAIISLTTAYLSYAGLGTNKMALPLFIVLLLTAIITFILKRKSISTHDESSLKFFIPIILFGLVNAALVLAPTLLDKAPYLFNDHTTYISNAEYIRDSGYSIPAHHDTPFWQNNTWMYQTMHFRMGAQFFVSFFAALLQTANVIVVYPSILGLIAFIFMGAIAFFYLTLRKEKPNTIECLFVLFFSLISINLNSQNLSLGFLPQTVGIILFITLSALIYETFYTHKKHFILIGLLFASLVLTYHEITLFYGAGVVMLMLFELFYKKTRENWLFIKVSASHIMALILSPIATKEFILGIHNSSQINDAGWHVSYSLLRYFQEFFGQDFHYLLPNNIHRFITIPGLYGSFLLIYFLLRRKFWAEKKEQYQFLLAIFSPFILALGIYAYLKLDPFTHELGHTWGMFKLVGWSYWIIPLVTGIAVFSYFKESFSKKIFICILLLSFLPSVSGNVYANYLNQKYGMQLYTKNYKDPLDDFVYIAKNKHLYAPANIIDYESHPNYPYLILSILKDNSTGDLNIFGSKLITSIERNFYQWISYRREHDNTEEPIKGLAGFFVYPQKSSSVYLFDSFSERETHGKDHLAWLTAKVGTIKVLVPKNEKAQFTIHVSNWQNKTEKFEVIFKDQVIFSGNVDYTPVTFTSPVLDQGNQQFSIKYYGDLRIPDTNDGRTLGLMLKNTNITSIK